MNKFPDYKKVSTESLIPYARNARVHSDAQVAQIAASIREFGFLNPIIIDGENGIIAGHGRVLAAQKLGIEELPCIEASHLTEAQRRAYVIADNKLAMNASWDDDLLRIEFDDLRAEGFDIALIGFDDDEMSGLLGPASNPGVSSGGAGSLSERFMVPPFSILNAREGWWQDRKRAWISLGIKSELGRGVGLLLEAEQVTSPGLNYYRDRKAKGAAPGGSPRPAANYKKRQRGDGRGKAMNG